MDTKYKIFVKTLLIFILLFCIKLPLQAQFFKGFVTAGGLISQIDGDEVYGFNKLGLTASLGVSMPLHTDWQETGFQLSTEVMYSERGAKQSEYEEPFIYKCSLKYIDIPLLFHYADAKAGVMLGIGLQYSRLIKSNEYWVLPNKYNEGWDRPLDTLNINFNKNDLCFVGDFRFTIYKNLKFDVRYQYSILPIRKDMEFFNSRSTDDTAYKTWKRNYHSNYLTFKFIYVINEQHNTYKTKPKRRTAY